MFVWRFQVLLFGRRMMQIDLKRFPVVIFASVIMLL